MKPLSLTNINARASYEVSASRDGFEFMTSAGVRTAHAEIEGEGFYAAIIVENTNPLLEEITTDFETAASALSK